MNNNTIRLLTWNANGVMKHLPELEIFLHSEKIDVCLIAETHFTRSTYAKIHGYSCYYAIHPADRARGGSAIFIRESIKHHEEPKIENETMQVTTVKVYMNNFKQYNISAIYCPPRYNLKKEDYTTLFETLGCNFIIGGDFNAKHTYWGSRLTTTKGKELLEAGLSSRCNFHSSNKPTYWPTDPTKTPDLIDFYISKGISENYIIVENNETLSSDHSPVVMTVSGTIIKRDKPTHLTNNKTNWILFKEILDDEINLDVPIRTPIQLEEELEKLTQKIQYAAWTSTKDEKKKVRSNLNIPMQIRDLVAKKRTARKTWQRVRTRDNKRKLNNLCNKLKKLIRITKNESINKYLSELSAYKETDYSLWKATKSIKRPHSQSPPIKMMNGEWARTDKQKAELFAAHLEETFQIPEQQTLEENITPTTKIDEEEISLITLKELKNEIKNNLSPKKSPGYDLITGYVVKQLPVKAIRKLLHIINGAIRMKYVPRQWKVAEVIMIPKPDKPMNDKKSYRPISLLPVLSKLFEKLLLKRLKIVIENRNLIPSHQFGFREGHSTIEQVHRITNVIENTLENKEICSTLFLDVAQAFDKVWHDGLEFKLKRDLPRQYYQILKSYISNRYFRVKQVEEYSSIREIRAGVPQGSVLGPVLYLLFTADIPKTTNVTTATFADDTAILAVGKTVEESTQKLQIEADKLTKWTKKWRIKLNETKSIHVNFTNLKINQLPVYVNSHQIPYANTAKYLGMTLDVKLKWKEHIKKKRRELEIKYRKLNWLIGKYSELTVGNKLLLYRQVLKPIWTYGIQLWGCTAKTNAKIIQAFQNKVLRAIVNAPWYIRNDHLHRDLNMKTVEEEIKKHAIKHGAKMEQHLNWEARALMVQPANQNRRLKRLKPIDLMR